MIIINAPCTFVRIEIRREDGGRELVATEILSADALEQFFEGRGLADFIREAQRRAVSGRWP